MTIEPNAGETWETRSYPIERVPLAMLRLRRDRLLRRSTDHSLRALKRWGERQWQRHRAQEWRAVDWLDVSFGDRGDDFIRNTVTAIVEVRAIRVDDLLRRWLELGGQDPELRTTADVIEIAVPLP